MTIIEMINKNKADCCGCSACMNICPTKCIEMKFDDEGFWYPYIDEDKCKHCGQCDKTCPVLNQKTNTNQVNPHTFAVINPDEFVRKRSSSGGVFYALAELIINQGGVVFGARFNENWEVIHDFTDNIKGIRSFQGSKYVQSNIGETYKQVNEFLKQGRKVLFSGTPCQIAGLQSFLGHDDDNLLLVDVICHGVPSPVIWKNYVKIHERNGDKICNIFFRKKEFSWINYFIEFIFEKSPKYLNFAGADNYMAAFLSNLSLRPSCYNCHFRIGVGNNKSDITIADFWGVQSILPQMFDDKGTSLVMVSTQKGVMYLTKTHMYNANVDYDKVKNSNPMIYTSAHMNPKRQEFFQALKQKSMSFESILELYTSTSKGLRAAIYNIMPFFDKKKPIFLGDKSFRNNVMNLFRIKSEDYIEFTDKEKWFVDFNKAAAAIRPYAIHIFFTDAYDFIKPKLLDLGLHENENFIDGRNLLSMFA